MKRNTLPATLAAVAVILGGCVVTSVYPWYTAKDLSYSPALVGSWSETGPAEDARNYWQFEPSGAQAYLLTTVGETETNRYTAHLFRLRQQTFLDLCPTNRCDGHLPLHYLLKVTLSDASLRYQLLNYDWLGKLVEKNPKAIRHLIVPDKSGDTNRSDQLVLTADPQELQQFILKYSRDTNAFTELKAMKRW